MHTRRSFSIGHEQRLMAEQDQGGTLPELIATRPLVHDFWRLS
jgi:hypothetical protein